MFPSSTSLYGQDGRIRVPSWADISAVREQRSLLPTDAELRPARSLDPDADDTNFGIRVGGRDTAERCPGGSDLVASPPTASFIDLPAAGAPASGSEVRDGLEEDAALAKLLQDEEDAAATAAGLGKGGLRQRASDLADDERLARALQAAEDEAGTDDSDADGMLQVEGESADEGGGPSATAVRRRRGGPAGSTGAKHSSSGPAAATMASDDDDDDDDDWEAQVAEEAAAEQEAVVRRRLKRPLVTAALEPAVAAVPSAMRKPSPWALSRPPRTGLSKAAARDARGDRGVRVGSKRRRVGAGAARKVTAFGDLPDEDDSPSPPLRRRVTKKKKCATKRVRGPAWLPEDSDVDGSRGSMDDFVAHDDSADDAAGSSEMEAVASDLASLTSSDEEAAEEADAHGALGIAIGDALADLTDSETEAAAARTAKASRRGRRPPAREPSEEPQERTELVLSDAVERAETALVAASDGEEGAVLAFPDSSDDSRLHLKPHQLKGVRWMLELRASGRNGILADEMGLGKTVQTLAVLAAVAKGAASAAVSTKGKGPKLPSGSRSRSRPQHLVIVPLSVVGQWETEAATWFPRSLVVHVHSGVPEARFGEDFVATLSACDVFVTSYELALRDVLGVGGGSGTEERFADALAALRAIQWDCVVVDEAQRLKRSTSRLPAALRRLAHQRMLLLTGTPLANNVNELWSLLSFVAPAIFDADVDVVLDDAGEAFVAQVIKRLHAAAKPFLLRRTKADMSPSPAADGGNDGSRGGGGPGAAEVRVRLAPSAVQVALARHLSATSTNAPAALRRVAMHPWLLSPALAPPVLTSLDEESPAGAHVTPSVLVPPSAKLRFLHYALPRLVAVGHKVLLFSGMTSSLDMIERLLQHGLHLPFVRLDGGVSRGERAAAVASFVRGRGASRSNSVTHTRSPSPAVGTAAAAAAGDDVAVVGATPAADVSVFLLSTRAGGLGLNLQSADTVILVDSDANPAADAQAVARADRMGQSRAVLTLRLCVAGSVDERVAAASKGKRALAAAVFGGGGGGSGPAKRSAALSRRASSAVMDVDGNASDAGTPASDSDGDGTDADADPAAAASRWDALLARDEADAAALQALPPRAVLRLGSAADVPSWLSVSVDVEVTRRALDAEDDAAAAVEARAAAADLARAAAMAAKGQRATRSGRVFAGAAGSRRDEPAAVAAAAPAAATGRGGRMAGRDARGGRAGRRPAKAAAAAAPVHRSRGSGGGLAAAAAATPTRTEELALAELGAMGFAVNGARLLDALRSARGNVAEAVDTLLAWQVEVRDDE
ncbi:hypothetical protein MMPV_000241 [Pyropia vietnamensis]